MTRIALDLMGGDHAPSSVVDGALLVADESPDVTVVLVGPPDVAAALPEERGRRFRSTFDNLARRLQSLHGEVRAARPDWGHVVDEARAIEDGLAAMIRTARAD